jgi:CheY-like chemotaxis protein/Tfp pilus assembly protein PilZ
MAGKILLVDDVPLFLEIQKGYLKTAPIAVITATNGAEALNIARQQRPDLVFMDLHMPVMDGAESCRLMRQDPALAKVPIIMVTAAGKPEDKALCLAAGCSGFLNKPVERAVFLQAARQYLPAIDRRDKRVPCHVPARFKMYGVTLTAKLADVSQNGVFVVAPVNVTVGSEVEVMFALPGMEQGKEIQASGKVVWVNKGADLSRDFFPAGFGVNFTKFGPESDYLLARFVEQT